MNDIYINIESQTYYKNRLLRYKPQKVLHKINVDIPRNKMTLILGTSGAGKSTLIKCILGLLDYNGTIKGCCPEDIAYIPQSIALNLKETVYDAVYWSCKFRYPQMSNVLVEGHARDYIRRVGLSDRENSLISSLSGGQKQRVSIAKELVRNMDILIADEIDTGLDAGTSRNLIRMIKGYTNKTRLIISHNVSNIDCFDKVIVLAKVSEITFNGDKSTHGTVVYSGSPENIRRFFNVTDPAEILAEINPVSEGGKGRAEEFLRKYREQF